MVPPPVRTEDQPIRLLEFSLDLRGKDITHHPIIGAKGFDWVIIDTSPDMGFYTQAALYAANYIITPVAPGHASNNGVQVLWDTSQRIRQLIESQQHARYLGFLATMYDNKPSTVRDYRNLLNFVSDILPTPKLESGHGIFFDTLIPFSQSIVTAKREVKLATQQHQAYPLLEKEGRAGDAYGKFILEVLSRA